METKTPPLNVVKLRTYVTGTFSVEIHTESVESAVEQLKRAIELTKEATGLALSKANAKDE